MRFENDNIIMQVLDLCGMLEIDELQALINNIECMIENKEEYNDDCSDDETITENELGEQLFGVNNHDCEGGR